ncbi:ammonium transporter Rh type A-like [Uloborus diversus]|uniref:ammonium transporter Rh type A-like n=1 Tax=Uloborus diversus TaxID=327109 RepID=UPI00240A6792|nr:ammonium transporter Rh type A-like [Uloborus diversus]
MVWKRKFEWTLALLQLFFIVVFAFFFKYGDDLLPKVSKFSNSSNDIEQEHQPNILPKYYPMFQDINAMIFFGVAFLYAFLGKYGYTGVGMNILMAAVAVQWGIISTIWWNLENGKMKLDVTSLIKGEFAAAVAVIAFGGIFGKISRLQMIAHTLIVVLIYTNVNHCCEVYLQTYDSGESVSLHLFAAIFGCAVAYVADKKKTVQGNPNEKPSYNSNIFCMIGTILLWAFWPSFNAGLDDGDSQHRAVLNTYLALIGSLISSFIVSSLLHKTGKFTMSHIQNATLAGGVGIAATSNLLVHPFGALIIGTISGSISVTGFQYLSPFLTKIQVYDPCGINSLHGIPGLFGGITSIVTALLANENSYGYSLYKFYPAMAPEANTTAFFEIQRSIPDIKPGINRTPEIQACYQLLYIVTVIVIATITGLITGWLLQSSWFDPLEEKQMYTDDTFWVVPTSNENEKVSNRSNTLQGSEAKENCYQMSTS